MINSDKCIEMCESLMLLSSLLGWWACQRQRQGTFAAGTKSSPTHLHQRSDPTIGIY